MLHRDIRSLNITPEGSDFMQIPISEIVLTANKLTEKYGTRNPYELADTLGITIMPRQFASQLGAYTKILNNRFIFIKDGLDRNLEKIVIYHELGHDRLHQALLAENGVFKEFHLFNMALDRMEYEANIFAAQISITDDDILDLIYQGYDSHQIAAILNSDVNLIGLKRDILCSQGYKFNQLDHDNKFLSSSRYGC